ncbi:hypothetical protein L1887_10923 [Cichorium endivia]|nr:hypothetical protein L1887_10923 [Cichorium endivia]
MKMFRGLLPILFLLGLVIKSVLVHAQDDQSGFISIDCGIEEGSAYTDNVTGINYVPDTDFIEGGEIHKILPIYNSFDVDTQLTTLTSFPQNTRSCYTLRPIQGKGNRYLIRARFMYGNYDFKSQLPEFDVYLGPDYWDTIKINSSSRPVNMEIIHVLSSDYIHVCLVNTGRGTPFVSVIELRLLAGDMYKETDYGSLYLFARVNFGSVFRTVRYKDDVYDRLWSSINWPNSTLLYTLDKVSSFLFTTIDPPSAVMSTAIMPTYPKDSININWNPDNTTDQFFMYMHFAEIEILKRNQTREFNIYLNGNLIYPKPFSPLNHTTITVYNAEPDIAAPTYTLTINKTKNSTLSPIINALELYVLKQIPQRQTDDRDASAMWSIKSTYGITRHWQGDPCAQQEFVWDGLRCSYNTTDSPRITFLNLSTSGLNGGIDQAFANLTMIETLDLSNNNLTGTVPHFLSGLNFLKVLNLKGNDFVGPVPAELIAKSKKGLLALSFDGESTNDTLSSCDTNPCKNTKGNKIIVPVIATVVSFVVIMTAVTAIWVIIKRRAHDKRKTGTGLEIRKQQYTYSDIQSITSNFNVVIGKGGFGTVYLGYIGDTEVAVKMLSESSLQGDKEFQAEAYLLLSVHHKNLTSLVGYCNERNQKGIIYEYMANGNLERHLFDTSSSVLNWEERIQIGCDAAHGPYYTSNRLTEKSDIYSFGVALLVIITGQPAIIKYKEDNIHISRWANLMLADGDMKNIVDPRLLGDFDINSAWKAVELAMACVAHTPSRRPTMNEVVMELNDCLVMEKARKETNPRQLTGLSSLNLESTYDPNPR